MKAALILNSDVLDIVFENRNKSYGAYNLRKYYDNRLTKSVGAMLVVVIILSAFTFLPKKKVVVDDSGYIPTMGYIIPPVKEKPKVPEKPKAAQPPAQKVATQIFVHPKIVPDVEVVKSIVKLSDSAVISNITQQGQPGSRLVIDLPVDAGTGSGGTGTDVAKPTVAENVVVDYAEVMPAFPGGIDALRRFLQKNLTNPKEMEEGEEVTVKMKFVVGIDGKLQSFETVQDGGEEFNKEVMRVLKKMPNWVPGKTHGQNVSVYFTIPVKFVSAN